MNGNESTVKHPKVFQGIWFIISCSRVLKRSNCAMQKAKKAQVELENRIKRDAPKPDNAMEQLLHKPRCPLIVYVTWRRSA
jgi:hypothetical protein